LAEREILRLEQEMADMDADPEMVKEFEKVRKEIEKITGQDLSNIPKTAEGLK
jgi:hypothetical protein